MRRHSRPGPRRWAVSGLTAAALLASTAAGVAQADDSQEQAEPAPLPVTFTGPADYAVSSQQGFPPEGEPSFEIGLSAPGDSDPDGDGIHTPVFSGDYTVTIDARGLEGVADVELPSTCDARGLLATCSGSEIYPEAFRNEDLGIRLKAGDASEAGDTGTIEVTGEGEGLEFGTHTVNVLVGGPEFEMRKLSEPDGFEAGDVFRARMGFKNVGGAAADGVVLRFSGSRGLTFPQRFSNCTYAVENEDSLIRRRRVAVCTFEGDFEPGAAYRVAPSVKVKTADFALRDILDYHFTALDPSEAGNLHDGTYKQGDGKELTLQRAKDGGTYTTWATLDLPTTNTYDLDMVGDRVKGAKGDTVTANVALHNHGPAWLAALRAGGPEPFGFNVGVPEGATVTKAPESCDVFTQDGESATRTYRCWTETPLLENEKREFPFELRIDKVVTGAKGLVALPKWGDRAEGDPSNDDGWIVLNGTGDEDTPGDTGGTGGDDGSDGSDDASGGSGDDDAATNGGSGDGSDDQGTDTDGGSLALTGTGAMTLGGVALALLTAGGGLLVLRKRRAATVTTDDSAV